MNISFDNIFTSARKNIKQPIFVWGAPRSGTTVLYEMLAKHPELGSPRLSDGKPREGTFVWWDALGVRRSEIEDRVITNRTIRKIDEAYTEILSEQNKSRLLDKSPFMTLWVPAIDKVFPDAFHIHIIRDGRAVVNSILYKLRFSNNTKDRIYREGDTLFGPQPKRLIQPTVVEPVERFHVLQWAELVKIGKSWQSLLGERYFELRYETLTEMPRESIKSIFDNVDLPYEDDWIDLQYDEQLKNRNYKWNPSLEGAAIADPGGFTLRNTLTKDDLDYFGEVNDLLLDLNYVFNSSCVKLILVTYFLV